MSVNAANSVQLDGNGSELSARATADGGNAGSLTINTRQLTVEDGAEATVKLYKLNTYNVLFTQP